MSKLIIDPNETAPGKLIVPGNEPVQRFMKPNRRGFVGILSAAFTAGVVAPMIVPYSSLMKIDTPQNRLVFAFATEGGTAWIKSMFNLSECLDPIIRSQWEGQHPWLRYDLVREAQIPPQYENRWGTVFLKPGIDAAYKRELRADLKRRVDNFKQGHTLRI